MTATSTPIAPGRPLSRSRPLTSFTSLRPLGTSGARLASARLALAQEPR